MAYKMISLYFWTWVVLKLLAYLVQEKNKYKVSACFFEPLTNSKDCSESRIKFFFQLFFTLTG